VPGTPLVLFNAWDAGSAKAVTASGAKAIATGSWSVAKANGFNDGEDLPLDLAIANLARIAALVELLKLLLKTKSESHNVAQRLIATSEDIEDLAQSDTADVPALHGWRRELFGNDALKLKHGKLAIGLSPDGQKVEVFER